MNNFNNNMYQDFVASLIADTYNTTSSVKTRLFVMRCYVEIIVRKLLDLPKNEHMTLGKPRIKKQISELSSGDYFLDNLDIILGKLNDASHTQALDAFSSTDFDEVFDKVINLLAFFHINYFDEYPFGSNAEVNSAFSLLPPILRYKVLTFLYNKNPNNIAVIDKLILSILKSHNKTSALEWIDSRKNELIQLPSISKGAIDKASELYGENVAKELMEKSPNMYELCLSKVDIVSNVIEQNGLLYDDFESALPYYEERGKVQGDSPEIAKFNDIMDFLYLGRIKALREMSKDPQSYLALNFLE